MSGDDSFIAGDDGDDSTAFDIMFSASGVDVDDNISGSSDVADALADLDIAASATATPAAAAAAAGGGSGSGSGQCRGLASGASGLSGVSGASDGNSKHLLAQTTSTLDVPAQLSSRPGGPFDVVGAGGEVQLGRLVNESMVGLPSSQR